MSNGDASLTAEVLHNKNCHVWEKALEITRKALNGKGINYHIDDKLIETKEKARMEEFSGSPQVKINDHDVDPDAKEITNYNVEGCRLYFYKGQVYEYPPGEMIIDFLEKKRRKNEKV